MPLAASGEVRAAYFVPEEAQIRNPHHLRALATACTQRGVRITGGAGATGFELQGGRLVRVLTEAGPFAADRICITSGAWTYTLLQQLGVSTGIMPIRGQMVLFRCPQRPFQRILNEGPRYLVPRDDGRVLVGSSEEEAGYDKGTTAEVLDELITLGRSLVPALREAAIEQTWAGLRPGTFDGLPYLGAVPGLDNAFVAAGHFRSGLHTSPATAVVLGQLIRGETPQIDLSPFRVGRG
jgi:glycine oxidase